MSRMLCRLVSLLVLCVFCMSMGCGGEPDTPSIKINELFAKSDLDGVDDWIELYNPGTEEVSLDGLQLKDASAVWDFPAGTKIAGKGYLIVVCDDSGKELHTNFKLTSKGETVTLQSKAGRVIDKVTFPALKAEQSWGRESDGADKWKVFVSPTPNKAN